MSTFRRVQFIKNVVFTRQPYTSLTDAESPDFTLTGEGPHVRVTRGATSCIVPWSNIAAAELEPVAPPAPPAPKQQEPRTFLPPKGNRR